MKVTYSVVGYSAVLTEYIPKQALGDRKVGDTMEWRGQEIIILSIARN